MILNLEFDLPCRPNLLDDVLEVLLVVGLKFLFYKIEIDKYYLKIHSKITMVAEI